MDDMNSAVLNFMALINAGVPWKLIDNAMGGGFRRRRVMLEAERRNLIRVYRSEGNPDEIEVIEFDMRRGA